MGTLRGLWAVAFVMALATVAGLAQAPQRGDAPAARIAVGAVWEDGLLLPIAVRSGNAWRPLTDDRDGPPLRLTSEATRLPRTGWTILPFDPNVAQRALTLDGEARVDDASPCADQEGIRTNAPSARARRPTNSSGSRSWGA